MKIYSFYTTSHTILKDVFISSLQDEYATEIECLDNLPTMQEISRTGDHVGGGRNIWLYKTQKVIDAIRANMGQVILFADIDIKFFQKTEPAILKCIGDFDILFQDDQFGGNVVNIGFMVIRCSEKTAEFFEAVLTMVQKQNIWDQKAVEMLLENSTVQNAGPGRVTKEGLRWNHLPLEFLPWHLVSSRFTLSSFARFRKIMALDFRKIVLCHGTEWGATSNPGRKLEIYAMCEAAIQHPTAWKISYAMNFVRVFLGSIIRPHLDRIKRWVGIR